MEYKNYYETLGVGREADPKEIRSAYRRLARQYHPDVNPGDPEAEERFKEINEAYEVLSDPQKRAKYDQLGREYSRWQESGRQPGDFDWGQWQSAAPGGSPGGQGQRVYVQYGTPEDLQDLFGDANPFSDFFSQIFGGMGGAPGEGAARRERGGFEYQVRPRRGQDFEQQIQVTLEEAYHGASRILQMDGRRLEIKIPPGIREGARLRFSGQGGRGTTGGEAGDLYLQVQIAPDPQFERRGDDLYTTAKVDLFTAVLGGETHVPTLDGPVLLTIPEGTQNGRTFRLSGKGMPLLRKADEHGDLYVQVHVQLPEDLTSEQRRLFTELRQISAEGSGA